MILRSRLDLKITGLWQGAYKFMKYKTFSQWLEMVKPATTNPAGSGGSNLTGNASGEVAKLASAKVTAALKSGKDPAAAASDVITAAVQKAGQKGSMNDVAELAKAAEKLKKMKAAMKK